MKPLTTKEQKFAELCVELGNQTEAYRQAFNTKNKDADWIKVNASQLANQTNVSLTISKLKESLREANNITKQTIIDHHMKMVKAWEELWELGQKKTKTKDETQRFYLLKEMVKGSDYRGSLDSLTKMLGFNEPDKLEVKDTTFKTKWG